MATEPLLRNLTLEIRLGLTAINGPVGSGKITLLQTLVGETVVQRGSAVFNVRRAGFCSQVPWILHDPIRHNVTGITGLEFDVKWYEFRIAACGLQPNMERLPAGDLTLLKTIATQMFSYQGHFRKAGISVILATHSNGIIVLDNGIVADCGSFNGVRSRRAQLVEFEDFAHEQGTGSSEGQGQSNTQSTTEVLPFDQGTTAAGSTQQDLHRRQGSWSVYAYDCRSAGTCYMILWAVFTLAGAFGSSYMTLWVEKWSDANRNAPNRQLGLYLGIYALLSALGTLGMAGECWIFFIRIITLTALYLHLELLEAVLGAPFSFFQRTDNSAIRFSQDMDLIDRTLPTHASVFTSSATYCLAQLVILCVVGKYMAAVVPVLAAVLFVVQRFYLRSSRQLRLLDIEAMAPLYQLFIETVRGVPTIRSFHLASCVPQQAHGHRDDAQKPFYMLLCIQQRRSGLCLLHMATSLTGSISAGALGVGLVLVLQFSEMLAQVLQFWTRLDTSIGAVARIRKFVREMPAEPADTAVSPEGWPMRGELCFDKVLSDISLRVAPGEKLAICGESGSGKTSLIITLLRLTDLRQDTITVDGVDITALAGRDVCANINVVPQEPFFVLGTARFNLDPQDQTSDDAIEVAIRKVGLLEWARRAGMRLLATKLVASEWSQGEKYLLALARALLVPSRILVSDETASSVIDSEWRQRTVISVLHRFAHIKRFDRVVVLDRGQLVECDTPQALLGRQSTFRKLYCAYSPRL
ncbi:hypothetical protein N657DRAFT_655720 [Parathielavia appendiculata]|uniref:Uncharacterized protein n=1 Tax=Parathielavia appendiculata TaxID=2587402 RepID=A0AAN6Z528_9PEZI|nr:hypothetical protein N657DRAFT_655720 [Parathielavia appendiculata]